MTRKVIGIAGYKKSGKTTLVERLVAEFTGRGLSVATVKHAHHAFDIDHKGRDSWRHRAAGSHEVAIVSDRMWAIIHPLHDEPEPGLDDILAKMAPSDLVIVEGYKRESYPKIEVRGEATTRVKGFNSCWISWPQAAIEKQNAAKTKVSFFMLGCSLLQTVLRQQGLHAPLFIS